MREEAPLDAVVQLAASCAKAQGSGKIGEVGDEVEEVGVGCDVEEWLVLGDEGARSRRRTSSRGAWLGGVGVAHGFEMVDGM
jgi:hypothetical protein